MSLTHSNHEYKGTRKRTYILLVNTALALLKKGVCRQSLSLPLKRECQGLPRIATFRRKVI